ncbi:MAG: class II aldolase/adducin family protein [Caldimicrobium sp.]|jgi:L-fuculose-phosphate aldolase
MKDLKEELLFWTKYLAKKGLLTGSEGNLSVRVGEGFFITPSGRIKETLEKKDLSYVTLEGEIISGRPSSEWGLHLKIYQKIPEAGAVVHAHPPFVLILERFGFDFREFFHPEARLILNELSLLPYFPPGSKNLWEFASNLCRNNCVVILKRHGVVSWGKTLEEAVNYVLILEKLAYIEYSFVGGKA